MDERASEGDGGADSAAAEESKPPTAEEVEREYDFDAFTPAQLERMSPDEWEVAFDPDAWITGDELLDRVEAELADRVSRRALFAIIERLNIDGQEHVMAYSDVDYAVVSPAGEVEGEGALRAEVEAVVAVCAMEEYDPPERPTGPLLPAPDEIGEGSGQLGNRLLLVLATVLLVAGVALLVSPLVVASGGRGSVLLTTVAGIGFAGFGLVLFVLVANARLSDRFRAEEYRRRLRAAGVGTGERPAFVPTGDDEQSGG